MKLVQRNLLLFSHIKVTGMKRKVDIGLNLVKEPSGTALKWLIGIIFVLQSQKLEIGIRAQLIFY